MCLVVCDLETSKPRRLESELCYCDTETEIREYHKIYSKKTGGMYIGKEEILAVIGDYKLSVSVCFVSEHEDAHTSTFAVGQVVTKGDTCLNVSAD